MSERPKEAGDHGATGQLVVDARGVLCPVPIIRLARTVREAQPGTTVVLLSDDPAAAHDVPAWCRLRGHALVSTHALDPGSAHLATLLAGHSGADPAGAEPQVPNLRRGDVLVHVVLVRA